MDIAYSYINSINLEKNISWLDKSRQRTVSGYARRALVQKPLRSPDGDYMKMRFGKMFYVTLTSEPMTFKL